MPRSSKSRDLTRKRKQLPNFPDAPQVPCGPKPKSVCLKVADRSICRQDFSVKSEPPDDNKSPAPWHDSNIIPGLGFPDHVISYAE